MMMVRFSMAARMQFAEGEGEQEWEDGGGGGSHHVPVRLVDPPRNERGVGREDAD